MKHCLLGIKTNGFIVLTCRNKKAGLSHFAGLSVKIILQYYREILLFLHFYDIIIKLLLYIHILYVI